MNKLKLWWRYYRMRRFLQTKLVLGSTILMSTLVDMEEELTDSSHQPFINNWDE